MNKNSYKMPEIRWVNNFKSSIENLKHLTYYSSSMKRNVGYAVYLPPGYEEKQQKFPVIYWLHGKGGDETSGYNAGVVSLFHDAVLNKSVDPALMVFPNCGSYSMFCDSYDRKIMGETILVKELVFLIDSSFNTINERSRRAIEGFSMGGFGAIKTAFKYPDLFSSAVIYAGSFHDLESVSQNRPEVFNSMFGARADYFQGNSPYILAEKNAGLIKDNIRIKLVNGSLDFTLKNNYKLNMLLDNLGIKYDFTLLEGYKHDPFPYYDAEGIKGFKFHFKP